MREKTPHLFLKFAALLLVSMLSVPIAGAETSDAASSFLRLLARDRAERVAALDEVRENWAPGFVPMALEMLRFSRDRELNLQLLELVAEKTDQDFGFDLDAWWQWQWNREAPVHPDYATFKSTLYSLIDPAFGGYFEPERQAAIRLDEVVWGGVRQDGIPPLRSPKMIPAGKARYLDDGDVVFGLEVDGDARAYPKRILGWHEMFVDEVGGVPVAGVYCTLCGTMILYGTRIEGRNHELGTSGFLYRSNKLMYDQATQSLWNTIWGEPVIGPLVGQDLRLERRSVVTTTWGEWRKRHPKTRVLSLDTGHQRDYAEGAAYREYFATDELMFGVPELDGRLANKAEVLALVFPEHPDEPLAISAAFLKENPVYHDAVEDQRFVVFTDASGANRVYEAGEIVFESWDGKKSAIDSEGHEWRLSEARLETEDGRVLHRLPAHRAFWFGWYAAYPQTRLVSLER